MDKTSAPSAGDISLSGRMTPQERLAVSRKALVRHMSRNSRNESDSTQEIDLRHTGDVGEQTTSQGENQGSKGPRVSTGTLGMLKRGLRSWWRHHPANFAVSVAQPLLGRYAHQSPFSLLAISAGVGAALVIFKPWRLVSMGGLALATLKSSEFTGMVMSMLSSPADENEPSA